ncbi:MAG TPA: hypothetical protein PKE69_17560 [Pyrinomonadaceae bacterium]|nr:hypothetical protein [Pyrinomonadaceae bacterium]
MMKKYLVNLMFGMTIGFLVLSFASETNAQRRESRNRLMTKAQVEKIVDRVEERLDNFIDKYDKSLDQSNLNGTNREDWLMNRARDLEGATDELRSDFNRNDAWIENKDEVRKCLNIATDIDKNMRNYNFGTATESNWEKVRYELNTLADIYNLPKVGSSAY